MTIEKSHNPVSSVTLKHTNSQKDLFSVAQRQFELVPIFKSSFHENNTLLTYSQLSYMKGTACMN